MFTEHTPVLVNEAIELLEPKNTGVYVDGTVGLGGHAAAVLQASAPNGRLIGIDLDLGALAVAKETLHSYRGRWTLIQGNFARLDRVLGKHSVTAVDGIILDLGASSLQLDTSSRGFSFTHAGQLDMRMAGKQSLSALQVVNHGRENELADIFARFGEEHWSKRIARRIVQVRKSEPVTTTLQLAEIVQKAIPRKTRHLRIHPATRVFQALRMYVNNELENLVTGLEVAVSALKPGGHMCVISFHSLEDRIVKQHFRTCSRFCICPPKTPICVCHHVPSLQILTKHPIKPTPEEVRRNPRSRSAKLRGAVKIHES